MKLVTNMDWCVSKMIPGRSGQVELRVFRRIGDKWRYADVHGMQFDTTEQADAVALDRGYLQPFHREDYALARRLHREELCQIHAQTIAAIPLCLTREAVIAVIGKSSVRVAEATGLPLARSHWACGWFDAARRLNPFVFEASAA